MCCAVCVVWCGCRASEVMLPDVRHPVFLALLEYLYTDQLEIPLDMAMELFQVTFLALSCQL